jgi:hypothetical protein
VANERIFFLLLTAAPRIDFLDGEAADPAETADLDPIRVFLVGDGEPIAASRLTLAASGKSRTSKIFAQFPWHRFAPGAEQLSGMFESTSTHIGESMGDYHVRLWAAHFDPHDVESVLGADGFFKLEILSKNKRRTAVFNAAH